MNPIRRAPVVLLVCLTLSLVACEPAEQQTGPRRRDTSDPPEVTLADGSAGPDAVRPDAVRPEDGTGADLGDVDPSDVDDDTGGDAPGDQIQPDGSCQDECPQDGQAACDELGRPQVCGDVDPDPCLEWRPLDPCPAGTACVAGACTASCASHDHLACLDGDAWWFDGCDQAEALADACGASEACANGACVPDCQPQAYAACYDGDAWWYDSCDQRTTLAEACGEAEICANGACVPDCQPQAYSACHDGDVWWYDSCDQRTILAEACAAGEACVDGACEGGVPAAWSCEPSYYGGADGCDCECGAYDPDCDVAGAAVYNCDPGELCDEQGHCAPVVVCTTHHHAACVSGDAYWFDSCDQQQELSDDCGLGESCVDGACVPTCAPQAYTACVGDDVYWFDACDQQGALADDCGVGEHCEAGACVSGVPSSWNCSATYYGAGDGCDCECGAYDPDCDAPGATIYGCDDYQLCDAQGHCQPITDCVTHDHQACVGGDVRWVDSCGDTEELVEDCQGHPCANAACDFTVPVAWTCSPGYYDNSDGCDCECGAYDPDCDEPGASVYNCDSGQDCDESGLCYTPCTPTVETSCVDDEVWWLDTCGEPVELAEICGDNAPCVDGACAPELPGVVVINELLADSQGGDQDTFVELRGAAGVSLDGFSLVGVNGNGGHTYQTIALAGAIGDDGLFVVMQPDARADWLAMADQLDDDVNYQNGPDSVELRFDGQVVDALGYGDFADAVFAGEGEPAPQPAEGQSLGRDLEGTDTDDNLSDFTLFTVPTPGAANELLLIPVAALVCPGTATPGEVITLDASGSSDGDGTITSYRFDFGDGSAPQEGGAASATHAYGEEAIQTVTLTVTDDDGLEASDACTIVVGVATPPSVSFIKPTGPVETSQGEAVEVIVLATAAPGLTIEAVELLADDAPVGEPMTTAPFETGFVVPMSQATGAAIALRARATDSAQQQATTEPVTLTVLNDLPSAAFTITKTGALSIRCDAASASDTETASEELQVRWDFEDDGAWDTDWVTNAPADHAYDEEGSYTVRLEVRDAVGQVGAATQDHTLSSVSHACGELTTTTWTGTVILDCPVTLPAGARLTVAAGTRVEASWADEDEDGVGDVGLSVDGVLEVSGTAAAPVLFTVHDEADTEPDAWAGITLRGDGAHVLSFATAEYAHVALDLQAPASVSDATLRLSSLGARGLPAGSSLTRVAVQQNTTGLLKTSPGAAELSDGEVSGSFGDGVVVTAGELDVLDSLISGNGHVGLVFEGDVGGLVTRSQITGNGYEGVRITTDGEVDPAMVLNRNNIEGNATVGARTVAEVGYAVSSSGYGTTSGSTWSAPGGVDVDAVRVAFSWEEVGSGCSSNSIRGRVRADDAEGEILVEVQHDVSERWHQINPYTAPIHASQLVPQVVRNDMACFGSLEVARAAYDEAGAHAEISVVVNGGPVDLRHNWLGAFPDALAVMTTGGPGAADIGGFTAEAYGPDWSATTWGGGAIEADTTWSGEITVTGHVVVPAGLSLTVAAGADVRFACGDEDGDAVGDCGVTVADGGAFVAAGTSDAQVTFGPYGDAPAPDDHEGLTLEDGASSTVSHLSVAYAHVGVRAGPGAHGWSHVVASHCGADGVQLIGVADMNVARVHAHDNARSGLRIQGASDLVIDKQGLQPTTIEDNGADGVYVTGGLSNVTLRNLSISDNGEAGVWFDAPYQGSSAPTATLTQALITGNRYGVRYTGSNHGALSHCQITYNRREGVRLEPRQRQDISYGYWYTDDPRPTISANDLYGNATEEVGVWLDPALEADCSGSGGCGNETVTDGPWSTPDGQAIEYAWVSYSESDSFHYIEGWVEGGGDYGARTVYSRDDTWESMLRAMGGYLEGTTSLTAKVKNDGQWGYGTTRVSGVHFHRVNDDDAHAELVAMLDEATLTLEGNYWGFAPASEDEVAARLVRSREEAVTPSGSLAVPVVGAGPQ